MSETKRKIKKLEKLAGELGITFNLDFKSFLDGGGGEASVPCEIDLDAEPGLTKSQAKAELMQLISEGIDDGYDIRKARDDGYRYTVKINDVEMEIFYDAPEVEPETVGKKDR